MKNEIRQIFVSLVWILLNEHKVQGEDSFDPPIKQSLIGSKEQNYEYQRLGKEIFQANCSVCHIGGTNIIIPEKNLKKNALEANGMNSINAISYQIINGKNGMPAFGGRLNEDEIEKVASYILEKSINDFQN